MSPQRHEFRLSFTNVDRAVHVDRTLVVSRHESETDEHLTLRILSWVLLWEERLAFGLGDAVGDAPDLLAEDLTGRVQTWIACGDIDPNHLRKVVQHNRDAVAHVVFGSGERRDAFVEEVESWGGRRPKGWERITLWTVDEALVKELAAHEALRQRWTVTLVGDHFYVDVDGAVSEGSVLRG
jgi:uncharacterized protein YaeQ